MSSTRLPTEELWGKNFDRNGKFGPHGCRVLARRCDTHDLRAIDNVIQTYDAAMVKRTRVKDLQQGGSLGVAFSPTGRQLIGYAHGGARSLGDRATGEELWTYHIDGTLPGYTFTPDGKHLIYAGLTGRIWGRGISSKACPAGSKAEAPTRGLATFATAGRRSGPRFHSAAIPTRWQSGCVRPGRWRLPVRRDDRNARGADGRTASLAPPESLFFSPDGKALYGRRGGWLVCVRMSPAATQELLAKSNVGPMWVKGSASSDEQIAELLSPDGTFLAHSQLDSVLSFRNSGLQEDETPFEILDAKTRAVVHSHAGESGL